VKPKHLKDLLIKVVIVSLVFLIAPYVLPYTIELLMMLDLAGLEAALVLLILQAKPIKSSILIRLYNWNYQIGLTILLLSGMYMFQMDTYLLHTLGSVIILICTCSFIAALAIWLPAIYFSHKGISRIYITNPLLPLLAGTPPAVPPQ